MFNFIKKLFNKKQEFQYDNYSSIHFVCINGTYTSLYVLGPNKILWLDYAQEELYTKIEIMDHMIENAPYLEFEKIIKFINEECEKLENANN